MRILTLCLLFLFLACTKEQSEQKTLKVICETAKSTYFKGPFDGDDFIITEIKYGGATWTFAVGGETLLLLKMEKINDTTGYSTTFYSELGPRQDRLLYRGRSYHQVLGE